MISFSFIIIIILIISIVFLILILLISLYFQFIFYPSLLSIIILLLLYLFVILRLLHFCSIFPHFFPFLPFFFPFVLHLNVIIFSFISTGLLKILREERQDHPNYWQNSSPLSLFCCIIIIGLEMDNITLYFSLPSHAYHLTSHPTPSLMRVCNKHISSYVSMPRFTCWRRSDTSSSSSLSSFATDSTSLTISTSLSSPWIR